MNFDVKAIAAHRLGGLAIVAGTCALCSCGGTGSDAGAGAASGMGASGAVAGTGGASAGSGGQGAGNGGGATGGTANGGASGTLNNGGAANGGSAGTANGGSAGTANGGSAGTANGGAGAGAGAGGTGGAGGTAGTASTDCPPEPPADRSFCATSRICHYDDCDGAGRTTALCTLQDLGPDNLQLAWSVDTVSCDAAVQCEGDGTGMSCAAGQVCLVLAGGTLSVECADHTCGTGPITCDCVMGCFGDCTTFGNSSGVTITCNTCPGPQQCP